MKAAHGNPITPGQRILAGWRGNLLAIGALALALSACRDETGGTEFPGATSRSIVYIESNIPVDNQNSILAYRRKEDGTLEALPGSPFLTGGRGVGNPQQILGPNDSDQPLVLSADKQRLFAVNSGSNTIAVFNVSSDGALQAVPGSPFASCGVNPVALAIVRNRLYVVNKNQDPERPSATRPNYSVFTIADNGSLTPLPNSTIETVVGASPSQAHVSPNGRVLFGADFLAFQSPTPAGTLRAFALDADGQLKPAPGTPQAIEGMGGALGLWAHPRQEVLYVGFPMQGKVGVYTYNGNSGELQFRSAVNAGKAVCWLRTNKAGTRLYALNTAENTASVYDVTNPTAPVEIQKFALKKPGPLFDSMSPAGMVTSSQPFYEELSADERFLYVLNQHAAPDFSANYNYVHTLAVDRDGRLSEPTEPMQPPVAATVRPQGIAEY